MNNERQTAQSILDKERRLALWSTYLIPGLIVSGLVTWPFNTPESMIVQSLYLLHSALGILVLPVAILYLATHFIRTLGNRSISVFFSGISAASLLLTVMFSGAYLLLVGQTELTRWVLTLHIYASCLTLLIAAAHGVTYIRNRNTKKRTTTAWPSTASITQSAIVLPLIIQIGVVIAVAAFWGSSVEQSYAPIPADYSKPYGEHPLRPSETEILGGDLVIENAVGGSDRCASCHEEIFDQWQSSAHRKAAMDPAYDRIVNLLMESKDIEATRYCEGCHAPITLLTGTLTPGGQHSGVKGSPANDEGVTCVSCHSINRVLHTKGVASYEFMPAQPYMFEYSDNAIAAFLNQRLIRMRPELHRKNFSADRINSPEVCGTCHAQFMDQDMNDWGWVKMQDEYSDWLNSPYSGRSNTGFVSADVTTCNDCHMPRSATSDPSRSAMGISKGHAFAAANTFIPLTTGDPAHLAEVRNFLMTNKMRLTIDVIDNKDVAQSETFLDETLRTQAIFPDYFYLGQTVKANILVANTGVGHNFPGGTIDINQAWVSIQVTDASGKTILSSGNVSADGTVDQTAYFYRSVAVDRHGKQLWRHDLFRMIGEHYRNVIPAGDTDSIPIEFEVPQWALGPLTVSAQLNYRKLTQRYTSWITGDEDLRVPVVVMAQDSALLPIVVRPPTGIAPNE